ncbi:MAG: EamA family transporter, partial [Alphaproteobacteria bacterium]
MKPFDFALYGFIVVGWSSSWLPLKWQVSTVAPEVSLIWRFLLAGCLMFLIGWLTRRRLALPLWGHGVAMALGVFLFSTNFALFYYASQWLASGLLAVVFASASLLNLFYGAAVFRTPIRL